METRLSTSVDDAWNIDDAWNVEDDDLYQFPWEAL